MLDGIEDLHEALRQFAARLSRAIDPRIHVTVDLSELPPCEVARGALEHALVPLVRLARDALLPHGGEMALSARHDFPVRATPAVRLLVSALGEATGRNRFAATLPVRRSLPAAVRRPGDEPPAVTQSGHAHRVGVLERHPGR